MREIFGNGIMGGVADLSVTTEKIADKAVTTGKIADKAVTTEQLGDASVGAEQIKDGVVTRAKLANDALFSPVVTVSADRDIAQSDLGKTLVANYNSTGERRVLTLTQEISTNLPVGFEFAVCRIYYSAYQIKFSGLRVIFDGKQHSSKENTQSVDLPEVGTMIALKKFETNYSNGDIWLLTGNVEVVT